MPQIAGDIGFIKLVHLAPMAVDGRAGAPRGYAPQGDAANAIFGGDRRLGRRALPISG